MASATVNTVQQIGASIGIAVLNTIAAAATAGHLAAHGTTPDVARRAAVEGFAEAGAWAAGIILAGALVVAFLMNTPRPESRPADDDAEAPEPLLAHR
ncbi:hypothetical protein [Actinomadura hallensis]|uniref:hypothetical protein n=1 Tax=Actinomadura hallensis TaxID=337895 RepID=UPI001C894DFD|nr:hypothetical protein [Actinomadura hallensis]